MQVQEVDSIIAIAAGKYFSSALKNVIAIADGEFFSLAVKKNGRVWAWDYNDAGQMGDGAKEDSNIPEKTDKF